MSAIRISRAGAVAVAAIFAVAFTTSWLAMRSFRAEGHTPFFYQANFEPAVMTACGRGFGMAVANPPELAAFLNVQRDDFDCALLPADRRAPPLTSTANANWYYLYRSAALVWSVTGVSWRALDGLVAAFAGVVGVVLFGLFRLVSGPHAAAALALTLALSPANLRQLPSLRDYSKAPFVLAAILILAVLVVRPLRRSTLWVLAAGYGAITGLGYGFRGDLAVMVPFGAGIVLLFAHGTIRANLARNAVAAAILLASFLAVASPVIRSLDKGGCQFHFALLGLTGSAGNELHLTPPIYSFGGPALDIFGNLKVGDYASRVLHRPPPVYCDAGYDAVSGRLYLEMARAFPADLAVRAYGSVLMILRMGMDIPEIQAGTSRAPEPIATLFNALRIVLSPISPVGVILTLAAVAAASAGSFRLGLAFAVFVLFLTGYPAIRFEERHWFHLRFIPWWAAALVAGQLWHRGWRGRDRVALARAVAGPAALVVALVAALWAIRMVQAAGVRQLIGEYLAAPIEDLPLDRTDGPRIGVRWQPADYGTAPERRGSDLLAITLDAGACGPGADPVKLMVKYDVDNNDAGHDLSTSFSVARPESGAEPTRVFVPVFWVGFGDQTFLRFSALEVAAAPPACVRSVARVTSGAQSPLWLETQVPPDWAAQRLYQTIDPPPLFKSLIKRPL